MLSLTRFEDFRPLEGDPLDSDGYPTDGALTYITNWPYDHPKGWKALMNFIKSIWWMPEWGWHERGKTYHISTGGWSGNESIIRVMSENHMFWTMCWVQSRRGGHYIFEVND